ncbi:MAG: hypothetical protein KF819_20900 [Labilithrix sp.]|nr:hypothetical protein [Labilithrix sp.]
MSEERAREEHVAAAEAAEAEAEADADASGDALPPDAIFDALWGRVLEAWDEDKPHEAALKYALANGMLPEIAGRYRKLKDDPDKSARAQRKIDGIVMAATQMMLATKTPPRTKVPWQWTATAFAMFAFVMALLLYKLLLR